ncbi:MAG: MBL fold metallo-hydrolase [Clostridia bacterium]|nr:MBL fold metallo-hydrolase [Clostridia bacterium]
MKIQYLGHSCFRLISDMGTTVVCDPYSSSMVGLNMPSVRCDVVTMSHHHNDHDCMDNVLGTPAELDAEITCCADDIAISTISTFHDDEKGAKRGNNLVFVFEAEGLKVAHMGDVGCLDDNVVNKLKCCDVLLLPVGGVYTVDANGAKRYVDEINPKIVIPMHYMTSSHKFALNSLDEFLSLFDEKQVIRSNNDSLTLYDNPQNDQPQVIVLNMFED